MKHRHKHATHRHVRADANLLMLALAAGLCLALGTTSLRASTLYVPNFSFEFQSTMSIDTRIDSWQKEPQPATYDTNFTAWDNLAGLFFNPPSPNPSHLDNASGNQLSYIFGYPEAGFFQDYDSVDWSGGPPSHAFNSRFEVGRSYLLTVGLTSSSVQPLTQGSTLQLSLYYRDALSNIVTVATTTVTYDTNVFTNITHLLDFQVNVPVVQSNQAWAGQNIGIQVQSTVSPTLIGGVWDVDNVRLIENIYVPNFSFESQATTSVDTRIDSWQKEPQPPTFDTNTFGAWDDLAGLFLNPPSPNPSHIDNADGNQLSYIFGYPGAGFFQDHDSVDWSGGPPSHAFNSRFKAGRSYLLTVGLTSSSVEPLSQGSTLQLSLYYRDALSNIVTVATTTVTYDTNVFTNITHLLDFQVNIPVVQSSQAWAGQNIGIQFQSTVSPALIGGVWDLDNVRLTETVATLIKNPTLTGGQFNLTMVSEPGLAFEILAATNVNQSLASWMSIGSFTNVTGVTGFTDSGASLSRRFYRAHLLP